MATPSCFCSSTKRACGGNAGQLAGDLEDLPQHPISLGVIAAQGIALLGGGDQRTVQCGGEQLGVAESVADAVAGDRVTVIAGITDECPPATDRFDDLIGEGYHPASGRGADGIVEP